MDSLSLRPVIQDNWRAALRLAVHPTQQRFVAGSRPIAAIALAKAYIRPGGLLWEPYAMYAGDEMVGFVALAYEPDSVACYWIYHFFIDHAQQGKGYGKAGLQALVAMVRARHPRCQEIKLTVHPENHRAHALYRTVGFQATGDMHEGEPVFSLRIGGC